jgi:hypothetical protein
VATVPASGRSVARTRVNWVSRAARFLCRSFAAAYPVSGIRYTGISNRRVPVAKPILLKCGMAPLLPRGAAVARARQFTVVGPGPARRGADTHIVESAARLRSGLRLLCRRSGPASNHRSQQNTRTCPFRRPHKPARGTGEHSGGLGARRKIKPPAPEGTWPVAIKRDESAPVTYRDRAGDARILKAPLTDLLLHLALVHIID